MASDSDNDEDFVTYGIPLEPLEEGKNVLIVHQIMCFPMPVLIVINCQDKYHCPYSPP